MLRHKVVTDNRTRKLWCILIKHSTSICLLFQHQFQSQFDSLHSLFCTFIILSTFIISNVCIKIFILALEVTLRIVIFAHSLISHRLKCRMNFVWIFHTECQALVCALLSIMEAQKRDEAELIVKKLKQFVDSHFLVKFLQKPVHVVKNC